MCSKVEVSMLLEPKLESFGARTEGKARGQGETRETRARARALYTGEVNFKLYERKTKKTARVGGDCNKWMIWYFEVRRKER